MLNIIILEKKRSDIFGEFEKQEKKKKETENKI